MNLKKLVCSVLTVTTTVMSLQAVMVRTAMAAPACSSVSTPTPECTAVRIGASTVPAPRIQWSLVSKDFVKESQAVIRSAGLDRNDLTGNTSASVLGLSANQVPAVVGAFPSNVPFVVGRYDPLSKELRIDIFKIERVLDGGKMSSNLYTTTFAPSYGDYWKAAGAYISPTDKQNGMTVGVNPFSRFQGSVTDDMFHNISLNGAMVAVGHAQRYVGAPLSVLVQYLPDRDEYTTKSGGVFTKKVTTHIDMYAKPQYFVGAPAEMHGRGVQVSFCANDPEAAGCYGYQTAYSGVVFQQFEGGNLFEDKQKMSEWSQTKKGFSLLAIFVIVFVAAFAFAVLGPALLPAAGGAAAGSGTITAGLWTQALGALTGTYGATAISAALIEASIFTAVSGAFGGGFGGTYGSPALLHAPREKGFEVPGDAGHDSVQRYIAAMKAAGSTTGAITSATTSVKRQVIGACDPGALLGQCASESGVIPRADQFSTFSGVEFVRDNGKPTRANPYSGN
jgi:hypothetical protein